MFDGMSVNELCCPAVGVGAVIVVEGGGND